MSEEKKTVFFEEDATLKPLDGVIVSIIGYGNQGRAQALNLKDSKVEVIVGNIRDDSFKRAEEDGFKTYPIGEAVKKSQVVFFLVPDEIMPMVYEKEIAPNLNPGSTMIFASGYNIAFDLVKVREDCNVLMIAPRMIGLGVRERFLSGEGFISYICVHQDATKTANDLLLALSKGIGALKMCSVEVTMKQEATLDLFMEQAWCPAFWRVMMTSINVLLKSGLPAEAVLSELYLSEELSFMCKSMAKIGFVDQMYHHSHTSQYGQMTRGPRYLEIGKQMEGKFQEAMEEIVSGKFAEEWSKGGKELSKQRFQACKYLAGRQYIQKIEKDVKRKLKLKDDKHEQVFEGIEEILKNKALGKEIEQLKELFSENLK